MKFTTLCASILLGSAYGQWHFVKDDFDKFMDSGNGTHLYGNETFTQFREKLLTRVSQFAEELIHNPQDVFKWFDGNKTEEQVLLTSENPEFGRKMLNVDDLLEKTFDHYYQSVKESIDAHSNTWSFAQQSASNADDWQPMGIDKYPFFGFIPAYHATVVPNGQPVSWSAPCFAGNTASATIASNDDNGVVIDVTITTSSPTSLTCTDRYLLGTFSGSMFKSFFFHGTHKFQWKTGKNVSDDFVWDLLNKGIRINRFIHDPIQLVVDLYETVQLFLQALTNPIPNETTAGRNLYFLKNYAKIQPEMKRRSIRDVEIDESLIQSGDFFGIVRLDGLDPMLAWAMGSTTGHTTIAIRDPNENNALYVAESTTKDSYWPVNGIQRTPFKQWMQLARNAGHNVVYAPLAPKYREKFNVTNAWDWFKTVEGLDYGYQTMLWAWVDTLDNNYPCLPPDFKDCLVYDHLELIFAWADSLIPKLGDLFVNEAFNHRLGTQGLRVAGLFRKASEMGIKHGELPTIVEQDSWMYHTTRYGKPALGESHVCCTFVCKTWKVAGIFDEIGQNVNCNEFTNLDAYSLKIYDEDQTLNKRPAQCVDADPSNQLCQLTGEFSLYLNDFNIKPMTPHMAEKCESKSPLYERSPNC